MYNKFNICISDFSNESQPGDYWYDCAILEATEILKQFSQKDWNLLLSQLKLQSLSLFWQKRLVECLGELHNPSELDVILELINTNDNDLFVACVDSLRFLDLSKLDDLKKEQLLSKVEISRKNASPPLQKVFDEFLKKTLSN